MPSTTPQTLSPIKGQCIAADTGEFAEMPPSEILDTLRGAVKSITAEPKVVPMDGVARAFDFIRDGVLKLDPRFLKIDPKVETAMNDAKKSLQAREEHPEAANLEVKLQAVRTILNQTIVLK